jgi:hypothetical protein
VGYSQAQQVQIPCTYIISGSDYDCVVISAVVPDNENANMTIVGLHQAGKVFIKIFLNLLDIFHFLKNF